MKEKGAADSSLFTTFKRQVANTHIVLSDKDKGLKTSSRVSIISKNPEADTLPISKLGTFISRFLPLPPEQFVYETFLTVSILNKPEGLAINSNGKLYISDTGNGRIVSFTPGDTDFTEIITGLSGPSGLAIGIDDTLYIADKGNNRILSFTEGNDEYAELITGLSSPTGIASDSVGNMYITNSTSGNIVKYVSPEMINYTFITGLNNPIGIAVDNNNNLYIAESGLDRILKINLDNNESVAIIEGMSKISWITFNNYGLLCFVSENIIYSSNVDGTTINYIYEPLSPQGIVFDAANRLLFVDTLDNTLFRISPKYRQFIGNLNVPRGIALDSANNLYIVEPGNQRVIKRTSVGDVDYSFMDTRTNNADGIVFDASNNLYVADHTRNVVIVYYSNGTIDYNFITNLNGPTGIALTGTTLYVADTGNNKVIQKIGNGAVTDFITDLNGPTGLAVSGSFLYVSQFETGKVSKYDAATGVVDNVNFITGLNEPEGIAIYNSKLYVSEYGLERVSTYDVVSGNVLTLNLVTDVTPIGLAFDSNGYLYIADYTSNSIIRYRENVSNFTYNVMTGVGDIYDLAVSRSGSTDTLYASDTLNGTILQKIGTADPTTLLGGLNTPRGIALDSGNNLYIAEAGTKRIIKRTSGGDVDYSFFNPVLSNPLGVTVLSSNIYVADTDNNRIIVYYSNGQINYSFITGLTSPTELVIISTTLYVLQPGKVSTYDATTGAVINVNFITGLSSPTGMAISGTSLYVSQTGSGKVSTYDATTGAVIDADFITGLSSPKGVAVYQNILYIAQSGSGKVSTYNSTSGIVIDTDFMTGLTSPHGVAIDENNKFVYVADTSNNRIRMQRTITDIPITSPTGLLLITNTLYVLNSGAGKVSRYNAVTGAVINETLITGLTSPYAILSHAGYIYVSQSGSGKVSRYVIGNFSLAEDLITGLNVPTGMVVSGTSLYVSQSGSGKVSRYNANTGAVINVNFITGLNYPTGLVATSSTTLNVLQSGSGKVSRYNSSTGAVIGENFITGLTSANGMVYLESKSYIFTGDGLILEYAGSSLIGNLFTGLSSPTGLAVLIEYSLIASITRTYFISDYSANKVLIRTPTTISSPQPKALAFNQNDGLYICRANNVFTIRLNSVANVVPLPVPAGITSVAITTSGSLFFYSSDDYIWERGPTGLSRRIQNINSDIKSLVAVGNTLYAISMNNLRELFPISRIIFSLGGFGFNDMALDNNNLYIADGNNNRIIRFNISNGEVVDFVTGITNPTAIAVINDDVYYRDGDQTRVNLANLANVTDTYLTGLNLPTQVALNSSDVLYICDQDNVKKYDSSLLSDGVAMLKNPTGISLDMSGNMYVSSTGSGTVWKRESSGLVNALFKQGLTNPTSLVAYEDKLYCVDTDGVRELTQDVLVINGSFTGIAAYNNNLYITDTTNGKIIRWNISTGETVDFATGLTNPSAIAVINGYVFVSNQANGTISQILPNGNVIDVANVTSGVYGLAGNIDVNLLYSDYLNGIIYNLEYSGDADTPLSPYTYPPGTSFNDMSTIFVAGLKIRDDKLYITDLRRHSIYVFNKNTKLLEVTYGTGVAGTSNTPGSLEFNRPSALAIDATGNIFVLDSANNLIRKINVADGSAMTVAGGGVDEDTSGGSATSKILHLVGGIAVYNSIVYFSDTLGNVVCKVENGNISNVIGEYSTPNQLACDSVGNLYVANTDLDKITKVTPQGNISDLVISGDIILDYPVSLEVGSTGRIYVTTTNGILRLNIDGTVTVISNILTLPYIALDSDENLYMYESRTNKILKIRSTFAQN